jgi:hypothetical protein
MHGDGPLRLDRFPSRQFLPPAPILEGAVARLREAVASALGVTDERVLLGESPEALLDGFVRTLVAPDDRVAIVEPCPPDHFRAVIAAGGRTVDAGRTAGMNARPSGLHLALAGGARGVIVADPNDPTTTTGDAARLASALEGAWMLVDRRLASLSPPAPSRPREACLYALGDGLGALAGDAELVAAVARIMGPLPRSGVARAEAGIEPLVRGGFALWNDGLRGGAPGADAEDLEHAVAAIPGATLRTGPVPFGWLAVRGVSGEALATSLARHGVEATWRAHHTWRNGVRVALPVEARRLSGALADAVAATSP